MTLLIKNIQSIEDDKYSEVFISRDKISALGNFPNKKADEVIDGGGAYLLPGFIDVNTDSDHYLSLFDWPAQDDFLKQGVTTIIGGMCGASLAPLIYGTLEAIRHWSYISKINVDWHSMEEFFSVMRKRKLGVNFGTLAGHSTIRRSIVGESLRNLTKGEFAVFSEFLRRALWEGGLGFSVALDFIHTRGVPYSELKEFAKIVSEYNGVLAFHLKNRKGELLESVEEIIKLANDVKSNILINHFLPLLNNEDEYRQSLEKISALSEEYNFHFDLYLDDKSILPLYFFLPLWAQNGGFEIMRKNIEDEWIAARIVKDFEEINPQDFIVAFAAGNEFLVGKSLEEIRQLYELPDWRLTLLKFMQVTSLKATIFYRNINQELIKLALSSKRFLIASNAASFPDSSSSKMLKPERATSTFTKFLEFVEKEKIMTFKEAVKKITAEPAAKFNLQKRGLIKEGYFADLVGFKNGEIKFVVVNGELAFKEGVFQNRFGGRILIHNG